MSAHLTWMIIRGNNSYLLKKRNINKPFSTEPNNLLNVASFRYNGLIHRKSVGIEAPADKKGFTVVTKRAKKHHKPGKSLVKTTMKSGPARSLLKLRRMLKKTHYRTDLTKAALRRASAILKSQKRTVPVKKTRAKKSE
ncbi:60S ribosomal protein L28-like [Nilaparvata lugens]|uniref:60S ribosomal protein L28-like n=1 Tax=Nilaparvata lugens TaxID=108931 RepID=UPI000B9996D9|nr:60S ribosomal protein L28-like [Nilaparvata lugens]XP_039286514.1 60S ribosomal protein L28-like [Nilaparvata lugens]